MNKIANENFNENLLHSTFLAEKNLRVLKHNETFGIFDRFGDIIERVDGEQGLYHAGTRFLSKCELRVSGQKPLLLSSFITEDNAVLAVDFTNPKLNDGKIPSGAIHIVRSIFLWNNSRNELVTIKNFLSDDIILKVGYTFAADYRDIFEVRGFKRSRHGVQQQPELLRDGIRMVYTGLDNVSRFTEISSVPTPESVSSDNLTISLRVPGKGYAATELKYCIGIEGETKPTTRTFAESYRIAKEEAASNKLLNTIVTTSNEQFNELINRSLSDIHSLTTETKWGPYPYAGVPWFSAPFGRDGIITALEMLWVNPSLGRSVLHFLAESQGTTKDDENDCAPGKIIHEARQGELANLGEIPFKRYYGSVDSTPLFILLAGAYYKRTGDLEFIRSIWPNIMAALTWMEVYGDLDGDGFIEYCRHSPKGLVHQGWKDSDNSIFHEDGELAEAPIALCEVQGYQFFALKRAAYLAHVVGEEGLADRLGEKKRKLEKKFHESFWLKDRGFFALALDKNKEPCRVKSSNIGHCLYSGIVRKEEAEEIANLLMSPEMFSGWGVRTIGENEALYNPISYHNGTIWPHDCAIVGAGLARYGHKEHCIRMLTGLFDASNLVDFHRLPELFCGFTRSPNKNPTIYPMSCAPQAWAAGSIFLLLGSCLGIKIKAASNEVVFFHPKLPTYLKGVTLRNLRINKESSVDLEFVNHGDDVGVNILQRDGNVKVVVIK